MINTVLFDMDGLLVDSEPLWEEAALECFPKYGINLTKELYLTTVGLRTREFVTHWFESFQIDPAQIPNAENFIFDTVCHKVATKGKLMPGVQHILEFFKKRDFKMAIASSSASRLIEQVIKTYHFEEYFPIYASAEFLEYGKPNPQVYIDCLQKVDAKYNETIVFEDSFNGMIAAKAARLKCVVVPAPFQYKEERWGASDLKISSLINFNGLHLESLGKK